MKTLSKTVLIIIFVGLALTIIAFFMGLNTNALVSFFNVDEEYGEQLTYTHDESINHLIVDVENRSLIVEFVEEASVTVLYHTHEKETWTYSENEDVLTITQKTRPFSLWFNLKFASSDKLTMYIQIPKSMEGQLSLETNVGDIIIDASETVVLKDVVFKSNTGSITLKNLTVDNLVAETDTGRIILTSISSAEAIDVETSTGRIDLEDLISNDLKASTSTGSVILKSSQINGQVDLKTSTGSIELRLTTATGYKLKTSTGSINMYFSSLSELKYDLETSTGEIQVNNVGQGNKHTTTNGSILIKASTNTGSIRIYVQA